MRAIIASRVVGAGLSCLSGLFLLSLLFTPGSCAGPNADAVPPTATPSSADAEAPAGVDTVGHITTFAIEFITYNLGEGRERVPNGMTVIREEGELRADLRSR